MSRITQTFNDKFTTSFFSVYKSQRFFQMTIFLTEILFVLFVNITFFHTSTLSLFLYFYVCDWVFSEKILTLCSSVIEHATLWWGDAHEDKKRKLKMCQNEHFSSSTPHINVHIHTQTELKEDTETLSFAIKSN